MLVTHETEVTAAQWAEMDSAQVPLVRPVKLGDSVLTELTVKRINWKLILDSKHLEGEAKIDMWIARLCLIPPSTVAQLDALDIVLLQRVFEGFQTPVRPVRTGAADSQT